MHECLCATIKFGLRRVVGITRNYFIRKTNDELLKNLKGTCKMTPDPDHLFKVDTNSVELNNTRKEQCHKTIAYSIWLSQRSRPDLQLSIDFYSKNTECA